MAKNSQQKEAAEPSINGASPPAPDNGTPEGKNPPAEKYKIISQKWKNKKVVGFEGEIAVFNAEGIAEVSKKLYDYLLTIPGYKAYS